MLYRSTAERAVLAALAGAAALAASGLASVAQASTPYPGVTYESWVEGFIPARIHVLEIDLSSTELSLEATQQGQRGQTPSAFAADAGAQMVINGDYFSPIQFDTAGLAMGGAAAWSSSSDDEVNGFVRFDHNGGRSNATISPPEQVVAAEDLPAGTQGVVGGRPMLVRNGVVVTSFDCTDYVAMPCERAPRTAVGLSEDGNTLWLVVVDGWQQGSEGMTAGELGDLLADLGAHDALMLDGGGSSAMYVGAEGGLVSTPSDGVERAVANHLAVRHGAQEPGTMIGFVRERDVIEGANIEGALVELDDGQTDITEANGYYTFSVSPPRYACATASKAGYRTKTQCRQVLSGQEVYNSIALYPHSDFIDAAPGAPDAAAIDAPPAPDGFAGDGPGGDAGGSDPGDDCSCTGSDPGAAAPLFAALFALPLLLRRRRSSS